MQFILRFKLGCVRKNNYHHDDFSVVIYHNQFFRTNALKCDEISKIAELDN